MATGTNRHYGTADASQYFNYTTAFQPPISLTNEQYVTENNYWRFEVDTIAPYNAIFKNTDNKYFMVSISTSPFTTSSRLISKQGYDDHEYSDPSFYYDADNYYNKTGVGLYCYVSSAVNDTFISGGTVNELLANVSTSTWPAIASDLYMFTYGGTVTPDGTMITVPVLWHSKYRDEPYKAEIILYVE